MTFTERHILESYETMLDSLSDSGKQELIDSLQKSMGTLPRDARTEAFFASFGGFVSDESAEEIIRDIRENRAFKRKDISF
jgi:hypothetical protein